MEYVQDIAKEKKLKQQFVIRWCAVIQHQQYVLETSK